MAKSTGLPPKVSWMKDRHGKMRLRFRDRGRAYYFRSALGTPEFQEELAECYKATAQKKPVGASRSPVGSIAALVALYYQSPAYASLAGSTKTVYRNILERFREEYGTGTVKGMERRHIRQILSGMSDRPTAANRLLDLIRQLMNLAIDEGWRKDNPAIGLKGYEKKSEGFHTWTEDEIAKYETRHPVGTVARLALDLMLYTGQRRSDAVRMGRQHIQGKYLRVDQVKTKALVMIPLHENLIQSIKATSGGDLTFLISGIGRPYTANGIGNKMRQWCDEAGLPECTAHGLRKAAARRLAEAGCSHAQIKAITGHVTDREVTRYIREANQTILADQAMDAVERSKQERDAG